MKYTLHNIEDTKRFATDFVKGLRGGEVVILSGELGAGKTTFVQLVAGLLGAKHQVNSPTFTLLQHYQTRPPHLRLGVGASKIIKTIHHLDLYRLDEEKELAALGLEELLGQPHIVTFIEWGEKFQNFFASYQPTVLRFSHGASATERIVEKK